MFVDLPQRLVRDPALWLAFAIFWGAFGLSLLLALGSRHYVEQVVGDTTMAHLQESFSKSPDDRDASTSGLMAGFYVMHNAGIGLRCFAAGLLLGIGGLFATLFNAVQIGAMFGFMLTVEERSNFLQFVTAHGPFELTAIVFSAAAGMRLGFSLVSTGGLARFDSLRQGRDRGYAHDRRRGDVVLPGGNDRGLCFAVGAAVCGQGCRGDRFGRDLGVLCRGSGPGEENVAVQLDQARIAICERSWFDNLDLALHVLRRHAKAAAVCAAVGVLPLAILNQALIVRFDDRLLGDEFSPSSYYLAVLLVMLEAPLATAPLTLYLGQALFVERPDRAGHRARFLGLPCRNCCCCRASSGRCSWCRS